MSGGRLSVAEAGTLFLSPRSLIVSFAGHGGVSVGVHSLSSFFKFIFETIHPRFGWRVCGGVEFLHTHSLVKHRNEGYGEGMSMLADDSLVMSRTKELCAAIAGDARFQELTQQVETFLNNDEARLQYQNVNERGEELHHKQHAGIELTSREIEEFEAARDQLLANNVARGFLEAQRELETLQRAIGKYVSLTLELAHVPTAEDFAAAESGGCCGGGGGGGCGCG